MKKRFFFLKTHTHTFSKIFHVTIHKSYAALHVLEDQVGESKYEHIS